MASFTKFFTSVLLAVVYASVSYAMPWPAGAKHATHRVRNIARGVQLESYHPESTYQTFGNGIDVPPSLAGGDLESSTISFVQSHLGIDRNTVGYKSGYTSDTGKYGYVKQYHNGIPFANAVANVAFKGDKVVAFGSSFVKPERIASEQASVTVDKAIAAAETALGGKYNGHPTTMEYFAKADGSVSLTHVIQVQNKKAGTWYEAFVDAHSGELVSVTDFVTRAIYRVLPITKMTLLEGVEDLTDPQNTASSPYGWHSDGQSSTTDTSGNNVVAYKDDESSTTSQSSDGLYFIYQEDPDTDPTTDVNLNAARVNAFYVVNSIHDTTYQYGFTEEAYNFQNNNFGKGGEGNDRVLMSVQDASGTDNANFATPPDGQSGICRMYLWTQTNPERDGSLENDIIAHELTHGLTNRMTGGGTGRCLQTTEAGGMGEGWSDAFAEWSEQKSATITDYRVGTYVYKPEGIRKYPYSTDPQVNPLRYSNVPDSDEVHDIGEIWANLLHNVYAALVEAYGFSYQAHTDPSGQEGNVVFLHLFIDALALQPCNPTFVTARDAWIQADVNRYNGYYKCVLWKAFASRGLGMSAANHVDDDTVPNECKS